MADQKEWHLTQPNASTTWEKVADSPGGIVTIAKFDPEFAHLVDHPCGETHTQTIIVQTSEQNSIEANLNSDANDKKYQQKVKLLVPPIKVKSFTENKREDKRRKFIEQVTAYKCRICNELGNSISEVEKHLMSQHEEEYLDDENWFEIAQKENIRLECNRCSNSFLSEGSRSFIVHMMDDHGLTEKEAAELFQKQNSIRKRKSLSILHDQIEIKKIKETAYYNKHLEAYVNDKGELRVRSARDNTSSIVQNDKENDNEIITGCDDIDVSADRYFSVVKGTNNTEDETIVKDLVVKKRFFETENKKIKLDIQANSGAASNIPKIDIYKRSSQEISKTGRKKGSKTIGISKLRQLNPNIKFIEESVIGTPCDIGRCGVRLVNPENLEYHRNHCHDSKSNEFICPECAKNTEPIHFTGTWGKVAMHLWREHQKDMELLKCDQCPQFRAFNKARLDDHMTKHSNVRKYDCSQCEKSFKQDRHLKDHLSRFHRIGREGQIMPEVEPKTFRCEICDRIFKSKNIMNSHIRTVHEGLKPFSCRHCNYATGNKSNLTAHERIHTGERPFACRYCGFRSADKNSLNKHVKRHTGEMQFYCKFCDFATIQAVNLGYHYNTSHTQEALQESLLFKCTFCRYFSLKEDTYYAHLFKKHNQPWPDHYIPKKNVEETVEDEENQEIL